MPQNIHATKHPHYTSSGLAEISQGSLRSAEVIIPIIKELIGPSSVLDVGCGLGTWLKVWREHGVDDIFGLDGGEVINEELMIPADKFRAVDLRVPFNLGRRFSIVQSLEVGEHLPHACEVGFVKSLSLHGDIVLFSAAIPGQGGYLHVNEQWQSHWAALFSEHGFETFDPIRPRVWDHPDVRVWYKQNTLLFVHESRVPAFASLLPAASDGHRRLDVVHPLLFTTKMENPQYWASAAVFPLRKLLSGLRIAIPRAMRRVLRRRIARN